MSKDAGFKVVTHMMPDLPNVGLERDIEQFIVSVLLSKRVVLMFGGVVVCILCIFALLILLELQCILTVSKYNLPEVSLPSVCRQQFRATVVNIGLTPTESLAVPAGRCHRNMSPHE